MKKQTILTFLMLMVFAITTSANSNYSEITFSDAQSNNCRSTEILPNYLNFTFNNSLDFSENILSEKDSTVDGCWSVVKSERGKRCNSTRSVSATLKNICTSTLDYKLCFYTNDGDDDCTILSSIDPGETFSGYTCNGSGRFYIYERVSGSGKKFPN